MAPYYLLTFMALLARFTPFPMGYWLGDKFAGLMFKALKGARKTTLFNIRLAFPDKDEVWITHVGRMAFGNMGKVAFEFFKCHGRPQLAVDRVVFENEEQIMALKDKPLLMGASHSGGWDLGGIALSAKGFHLGVIVAAIRQKGVERFVRENRSASGIDLMYRDPGIRSACLKRLQDGGQLVITPDQNAGNRGVEITFFGHPCAGFRGPAEFALETGLPLIPIFPYRMKDNRVGARMGAPIRPEDYQGESAVRDITQEWNNQLEGFIRDYPESYFWMHRRWKGTVPGA